MNNEIVLSKLINEYYDNKQCADTYKKLCDDFNAQIKKIFNDSNITEYTTTDGVVAKLTTQKRESFDEEKLIAKLKVLNGYTAIKTIEVVDMDELENLIYHGHIDAGQLANCKQVKEVAVLKVNKTKKESN